MRQYETFELRFSAEKPHGPWADIPLTVSFQHEGEVKTVKGFYDGDGVYLVRFLPLAPGVYQWKAEGVTEAQGEEICQPANGAHGPVKAADTHFEYADGTLFYPFGTTVYALAHQDDNLVNQTLESLLHAPFNKVRMCVFPKDYDYNKNEPPFYPFEKKADGSWDAGRPCTAFWQRFEKILDRICSMGIQVDLILFHPYDRWGLDAMSPEDNLLYLDYLLRRFAAKPGLWWSMANEYDLCRKKDLADWERLESFVAENDPYRHLLSCHNCFCFWDASRPGITHASIQTKALTEIPRWIAGYQKPVIIDECCYEGNLPAFWGSISAREMVNRFWRCCASGAYCTHGETFLDENNIIWWAKGGMLKGASAPRIAFLRALLEELPGPLTPIPDQMEIFGQINALNLDYVLAGIPEAARAFAEPAARSVARMEETDKTVHLRGEHRWAAHCGDEAFLWFHDLQCYGQQTLDLPENKQYRVEWIDIWEMTRSELVDHAAGKTTIQLPGKEGIAVLAVQSR